MKIVSFVEEKFLVYNEGESFMKKWLLSRKKAVAFICGILFAEALPLMGWTSLIEEGWAVYTTGVLLVAAILALVSTAGDKPFP